MINLSRKKSASSRDGTQPLKVAQIKSLRSELSKGWQVVKHHHLEKEFKFKDFLTALTFTNKIGGLAERQQHHPEIYLSWGKVKLTLWTHTVDGLTESDFIFAACLDKIN